jgi:hypothetical protein
MFVLVLYGTTGTVRVFIFLINSSDIEHGGRRCIVVFVIVLLHLSSTTVRVLRFKLTSSAVPVCTVLLIFLTSSNKYTVEQNCKYVITVNIFTHKCVILHIY